MKRGKKNAARACLFNTLCDFYPQLMHRWIAGPYSSCEASAAERFRSNDVDQFEKFR